ncbi:hypothetical protein K431DRAFT_282319 [Polychaeton citri CBS 116435]|uniref:COP9 signalosome complex subunit 3 n=1 Tax=Polychaeton citri CBS 116435 TaxID=1314669 RepID=A0A9P4UTF7_9PEZI|nr:hypothetical protein K431DRAFT_282319 [Polychaeton citri CBS 116435]
MAEILPHLLAFPPDKPIKTAKEYDDAITNFKQRLGKISHQQWTATVDDAKQTTLLDLLDPSINTLPYLLCLVEQIKAAGKAKKKKEKALDHAVIFLTSFDPVQVRYLGQDWRNIFEWSCHASHDLGVLQLQFLAAALLRLDPSAGTFTTNHLVFLQCCLNNGVPSQALPILQKPIYAFPQTNPKSVPTDLLCDDHDLSNGFITPKSGLSGRIHPETVLEYYLLGAHVHLGQRNYTRARLYLESVILYPSASHTCSAFQVEAYKKFLLTGLLAVGRAWPQPRTVDQSVLKSIQALSKAYESLVDCFEKRNVLKFNAEADVNAKEWQNDGNFRLVMEVSNALQRYRVIDLQKTYAALPISRVAAHLGFDQNFASNFLTDIIHAGQLNASITSGSSAGDSVLRFNLKQSAATLPLSTSSQHGDEADLEAQNARIEMLVTYIRDADRRLQLTREYSEYAKKAKKMGGLGSGSAEDIADQMDLTYDAPMSTPFGPLGEEDGDENLMD